MQWFIRLPRYGRPLAALNRNGIDIERRARGRRGSHRRVSPASLLEFMLDVFDFFTEPSRFPKLPLLLRRFRGPRLGEFPHIPSGNPAL